MKLVKTQVISSHLCNFSWPIVQVIFFTIMKYTTFSFTNYKPSGLHQLKLQMEPSTPRCYMLEVAFDKLWLRCGIITLRCYYAVRHVLTHGLWEWNVVWDCPNQSAYWTKQNFLKLMAHLLKFHEIKKPCQINHSIYQFCWIRPLSSHRRPSGWLGCVRYRIFVYLIVWPILILTFVNWEFITILNMLSLEKLDCIEAAPALDHTIYWYHWLLYTDITHWLM